MLARRGRRCYLFAIPTGSISATARLTAYARALEAQRRDALFRDPYALQLAGREGEELARQSGVAARIAAGVAIRTVVFDEWLMRKVREEGVDLIINLAAALDTRPWRLDLPSQLRWLDVDMPDILQYKMGLMGAQPLCAYEVGHADPTDPTAISRLLERCSAAKRALVLSEGLLVSLTAQQVMSLARTLHGRSWIVWWITDLAGPRPLAAMERQWGSVDTGTCFKFAPTNRTEFFRALGWHETEFRSFQFFIDAVDPRRSRTS